MRKKKHKKDLGSGSKTPISKTLKNRPYIAYYRVSTDRQGKSGLGLEAQRTAVKDYLKGNLLFRQFTEVESGKRDHRPELDKALDLCKKHKATLVVAKLDRLSRDLHFITSLGKAKIDFGICDMPEATPLTINIMGSIAQWEREAISKRTSQALQELKKKGVKLGYNNPRVKKGLKKYWKENAQTKKEQVKNNKRRKIIKKDLITKADEFATKHENTFILLNEQGLGLKEIAEKLTSMKIQTRQGKKKWNITQVVRIKERLGIN